MSKSQEALNGKRLAIMTHVSTASVTVRLTDGTTHDVHISSPELESRLSYRLRSGNPGVEVEFVNGRGASVRLID